MHDPGALLRAFAQLHVIDELVEKLVDQVISVRAVVNEAVIEGRSEQTSR